MTYVHNLRGVSESGYSPIPLASINRFSIPRSLNIVAGKEEMPSGFHKSLN